MGNIFKSELLKKFQFYHVSLFGRETGQCLTDLLVGMSGHYLGLGIKGTPSGGELLVEGIVKASTS